jgi:ERCC4-type nuclease
MTHRFIRVYWQVSTLKTYFNKNVVVIEFGDEDECSK